MCEYVFRILSLKTKGTGASSWLFDFVSSSSHHRNFLGATFLSSFFTSALQFARILGFTFLHHEYPLA
jgi:hypothetical protein